MNPGFTSNKPTLNYGDAFDLLQLFILFTLQCAHHTWFLAADMQLFELFLLTVILTAK